MSYSPISLSDPSVYTDDANKPTNGAAVVADFNAIIAQVNVNGVSLDNVLNNAVSLSGVKTFTNQATFSAGFKTDSISEVTSANGVDVDGVLCKDGYVNIGVTGTPASPQNGDLWINNTTLKIRARVNNTTEEVATVNYVDNVATTPEKYTDCAPPTWVSASSVSVAHFIGKDSTNSTLISKTTSTTLSLTTSGFNGLATDETEAASTTYYLYAITNSLRPTPTPGLFADSADLSTGGTLAGLPFDTSGTLTGTVSSTASSNTVTGSGTTFLSDYVAGESIVISGGDTLVILSVDSDTQITTSSVASTTVSGATHSRKSPYNKYFQLPWKIYNDASSNIFKIIPRLGQYMSAPQTITSAGTLALTHSLGSAPTHVAWFLVCSTGEKGYSAGDIVNWSGNISNSVQNNFGLYSWVTDTAVNVQFGNATAVFYVLSRSSPGDGDSLTNANWKLVALASR